MPETSDSPPAELLKEASLYRLREFARWAARRDELVCAARKAGATYTEIIAASSLSRGTVTAILDRAGLTGDGLAEAQEHAMSSPTPTANQSRFFPHHPHFVHAEPALHGVRWVFQPFTGAEPEPQPLPYEKGLHDNEPRAAEWQERNDELDAARNLWAQARFARELEPLLRRAHKVWTETVAPRWAALQEAWAALENPPNGWEAAVHRLITAQAEIQPVVQNWDNQHVTPIAQLDGQQPGYVSEYGPSVRDVADRIGVPIDEWAIRLGTYYGRILLHHYELGDRSGYSGGPAEQLTDLIDKQRRHMADVAQYVRRPAEQS